MRIIFEPHGKKGAVSFWILSNVYLPEVMESKSAYLLDKISSYHKEFGGWFPADLGFHSKKPIYKGHKPMSPCPILGKKCYYDGSTLNAERPMRILIKEGTEGLWKYLEDYYTRVFYTK